VICCPVSFDGFCVESGIPVPVPGLPPTVSVSAPVTMNPLFVMSSTIFFAVSGLEDRMTVTPIMTPSGNCPVGFKEFLVASCPL